MMTTLVCPPQRNHASATLQELEHLTNSFGQLKQAQAKFLGCMNDVGEMNPETARACRPSAVAAGSKRDASLTGSCPARGSSPARPILIPLTSSLYVPGKLTDVDNVIIDVGTGYFVSKASTSVPLRACFDQSC